MTYYDRGLFNGPEILKSRQSRTRQKVLKGAFSFSLWPRSPQITLGDTREDWVSVGKDIRNAMKAFETCE